MAGIDQSTHRVANKILIPRNTPLPARVTYKFVTKETDQQSIAVKVLEGETENLDGCSVLGKAVLRDLPMDLPKGHPIEVIYHCQENGRVEVTAKVADTDHAVTVQFERERMMPLEDLRAWRDAVDHGSAFENLGPLLDRLKRDGVRDQSEQVSEASDADWGSKTKSIETAEYRTAATSGSNESDSGEAAARMQTGRKQEVSPIWVFVGAIVGALLLILLIRLGLG